MARIGMGLSFEVIGERTKLGYWGAGVVLSIGWAIGVPLVIFVYNGRTLDWTAPVSLKGLILCIFTLWSLRWIKKSSSAAVASLKDKLDSMTTRELERSPIQSAVWKAGLVMDLILYGAWVFYFDNPIQRWGIVALIYNTAIWLPVSLMFVDLFSLFFTVFLTSRVVGKEAHLDMLHPDKCGGLRSYSRHILRSSGIYYIVLSVATFARSEFLQVSWVLLETIVGWFLGVVFVIVSLYYLNANTRRQKLHAMESCSKQLTNLGGMSATSSEKAIKSLFLYRVMDQVDKTNVWSLNTALIRDFFVSSLIPFLVLAILTRLLQMFGVL
jgi:hypothetical protein